MKFKNVDLDKGAFFSIQITAMILDKTYIAFGLIFLYNFKDRSTNIYLAY